MDLRIANPQPRALVDRLRLWKPRLAAATPSATPGEGYQCIMIAANEGTDAVRTVDEIICGPSSPVVARLVVSTHRVVLIAKIMPADKLLHSLFGWRTMRDTRLASDHWIRDTHVF
jgi:hypothetical protein